MLTAVFRGHEVYVAVAVLVTCAVGGAVYLRARHRVHRPAAVALWAASTAAVLLLTWWGSGGVGVRDCVINKDILEPFGTEQGRLNAVMLVPFGVLGTLATRRLGLMAALSVLFPACIEIGQALIPFVSRMCDTSDLVTNATGSLVGVAVGTLLNLALKAPPPDRSTPATRHALTACGVTAALLSGSAALWLEPLVMERTENTVSAGTDHAAAVQKALDEAFGGHYTVDSAEFTTAEGGRGTVTGHFQAGAAELSWPDREQFTVNLTPSHLEEGHSFAVEGTSGPVTSAADAELVATTYATRFAPWGLVDSEATAHSVEGDEEPGWVVSWRRWDGDILLPMRLDVTVEPTGRIRHLIAHTIDDPDLPQHRTSEEEAWALFDDHGPDTAPLQREDPVLLAVRDDDHWRVHWVLSATGDHRLHTVTVDSTTGEVHTAEERPLLPPS